MANNVGFTLLSQLDDFDILDVGLDCGDEALTQQSFKDECDINITLARYGQGASLSPPVPWESVDFTGVHDFESAQAVLLDAQDAFDLLPATVRERFHNSPAELIHFISDDKNVSEARTLGLLADQVEPDATLQPDATAAP